MTSQEKLDAIDALFQQAEAELESHKPIVGLDVFSDELNQTELRSTTIKTVHAIRSVEKSLSINNSETNSNEEIKKFASVTKRVNAASEKSIRIGKRISELYKLATEDNQELIGDHSTPDKDNPIFLKEKEIEINAAMAEIAHTVKSIPTVQDQKRQSDDETISPNLKSQLFDIVETATRDIIRNEIKHILDELLPKRLERRSNLSKKKGKKLNSKKIQAKKTQAKKTQAKKTQAKKTQAKKTQTKKTQTKKTQTRKTQTRKTQTKNTRASK